MGCHDIALRYIGDCVKTHVDAIEEMSLYYRCGCSFAISTVHMSVLFGIFTLGDWVCW